MSAPVEGFEVRALEGADVEAMAALREEMLRDAPFAFLRSAGDRDAVEPCVYAERVASPDNGLFGAFDAVGTLVAAAAVHRVPLDKIAHRATVTGVYTQPAHRRRGLSRALVLECVAWAERSPGVEQVQLAAHAGNVAALTLYEDLGFVRWGVEPRALKVEGEYADEVHLVRML
ncbi:MAG: GNAT family protein [Planctomycetota bacterium]